MVNIHIPLRLLIRLSYSRAEQEISDRRRRMSQGAQQDEWSDDEQEEDEDDEQEDKVNNLITASKLRAKLPLKLASGKWQVTDKICVHFDNADYSYQKSETYLSVVDGSRPGQAQSPDHNLRLRQPQLCSWPMTTLEP